MPRVCSAPHGSSYRVCCGRSQCIGRMQPVSGRDVRDRIRYGLTWGAERHLSGLAPAVCLVGMYTSVNTTKAYQPMSFGSKQDLACLALCDVLGIVQLSSPSTAVQQQYRGPLCVHRQWRVLHAMSCNMTETHSADHLGPGYSSVCLKALFLTVEYGNTCNIMLPACFPAECQKHADRTIRSKGFCFESE